MADTCFFISIGGGSCKQCMFSGGGVCNVTRETSDLRCVDGIFIPMKANAAKVCPLEISVFGKRAKHIHKESMGNGKGKS